MLEGLFAGAIADAHERSLSVSVKQLEAMVAEMPPAIDALRALSPAANIRVIAEIKRRSPSRGHLAEIPDAAELASIYESHGASAISVLTESRGFAGSPADLMAARERVSIPLLRKDFIANEYQLLEARAWGADLVLLIAAGLKPSRLVELAKFAREIGLEVLLETHSQAEIEATAAANCRLVGINTRNLETFETDIGLFEKLASALPEGSIKVAESSVKTVTDVVNYRNAGADCVLVGEALVTGDAAALLAEFTAV